MICWRNLIGLVPRTPDGVASPRVAAEAVSVDLSDGTISPWLEPKLVAKLPSDTCVAHLKDCCWRGSPDAQMKFTDARTSDTCYLSTPCDCPMFIEDWCNGEPAVLGFPTPEAPMAINEDTPNDDAFTELRTYYITYGDHCREGAPSPPSVAIKADKDDCVVVGIPPFDPGKYPVSKVYVYRSHSTWDMSVGAGTNAGNDGVMSGFVSPTNSDVDCYLVACLDPDVPFFEDKGDVLTANMGRMLTSHGFTPPVDGLCIAGETDNGRLVGYKDDCVYFSEPNHHWAWPIKHKKKLGCKVRGICLTGNTLFVGTDANPFIIQDDAPCEADASSRRSILEVHHPYPLCSEKSMVCTSSGAIWASTDGLVLMRADGAVTLLSESRYRPQDWGQVDPVGVTGALYRDSYIFSSGIYSAVYDLNIRSHQQEGNQALSTLCIHPKCWINDKAGALYFLDPCGKVYEWNAGRDWMTYNYRSGTISLPGPVTFTSARVDYLNTTKRDKNACPVTIQFFADGEPVCGRTIEHNRPFRVKIPRACEISFEVTGTEPIRQVCLAPGLAELGQDGFQQAV